MAPKAIHFGEAKVAELNTMVDLSHRIGVVSIANPMKASVPGIVHRATKGAKFIATFSLLNRSRRQERSLHWTTHSVCIFLRVRFPGKKLSNAWFVVVEDLNVFYDGLANYANESSYHRLVDAT